MFFFSKKKISFQKKNLRPIFCGPKNFLFSKTKFFPRPKNIFFTKKIRRQNIFFSQKKISEQKKVFLSNKTNFSPTKKIYA